MSAFKQRKNTNILRLICDVWPLIRDLSRQRVGVLTSGFLLVIGGRIASLILPSSTRFIVDEVILRHRSDLLVPLFFKILAANIVQATCYATVTGMLTTQSHEIVAELRCKLQEHVGKLSLAFYDSTSDGVLVSRILADAEGSRNVFGTGLVDFIGSMFTACIAVGFLLCINVPLTLVVIVSLFSSTFLTRRCFHHLQAAFRDNFQAHAHLMGKLTESIAGIRVIKAYHAERREASVFAKGAKNLFLASKASTRAQTILIFTNTVTVGLISAGILCIAADQIFRGHLTLGGMMTFVSFVAFLIMPTQQLPALGATLIQALAGLNRTQELLREPPEIDCLSRTQRIGRIYGGVSFQNVTFAYEPDKLVLHGVTFEARPGTVTAIVGSSGSGKSTILSLIAAFYEPQTGKILIDGSDLSKIQLSCYRSQLGVVLQETFLFDGTIRDNVVFNRPDATDTEILTACRIAYVDEFSERFPDKYDTIVGQRGVRLSGGQRQRLSIARAILADPRILLLDEATSSVDSESEAAIQKGMSYLMNGRTTFVVAHRLSTVRRADQILVLENGSVVERGTHAELYAAQNRYYALYTQQHLFRSNACGD